jgi:hypothetical protein
MFEMIKAFIARLKNGNIITPFNTESDDASDTKVIYLTDGTVSFPADWIQVDNPFGTNEEATNVLVVEAQNEKRYGVPHFILPVNIDRVTEEVRRKVIDACQTVYPALADVIAKQIEPPMTDYKTDPDYWDKVKASQDSPLLGVFRVVATDDWWYDADHKYPFDVVVIRRYSKEKGDGLEE